MNTSVLLKFESALFKYSDVVCLPQLLGIALKDRSLSIQLHKLYKENLINSLTFQVESHYQMKQQKSNQLCVYLFYYSKWELASRTVRARRPTSRPRLCRQVRRPVVTTTTTITTTTIVITTEAAAAGAVALGSTATSPRRPTTSYRSRSRRRLRPHSHPRRRGDSTTTPRTRAGRVTVRCRTVGPRSSPGATDWPSTPRTGTTDRPTNRCRRYHSRGSCRAGAEGPWR